MNVLESDNITSTISYLRQNVYSLPNFKSSLILNLNKSLNASNINFIPDQYGGWIINITMNSSDTINSFNSSDFYLTKVTSALYNTLIEFGEAREDTSNLVNVTIVGCNNIVIRI